MSKKEEQKITEDLILTAVSEVITPANNTDLNLNELIERIDVLAQNKNPYTVSKEVEDLKSIFYIKLKAENKNQEEELTEKENAIDTFPKEGTLHPLEIKFKLTYVNYKNKKFEFRKQREQEEAKNLRAKKKIIEDIDMLTQEDESIKKTFEQFRELQENWKNIGNVPQTENNNLWQSYHHHVELFYDYIRINNDLRDLDFTRNLEEKTRICKKAETLIDTRSVNKMHAALQELHEHWKNVGPVKRELREDLWERFQNISKILNKKRNDHFLEIKEKNQEKIAKKNTICKKIDDLTTKPITSHDAWQLTTNKVSKLESEWRNIGRLNKVENTLAWKKIRESLNNFYDKKNTFYKQKKKEQNKVITTKISICEKAELLQNSTNWQVAGNQLIALQRQWTDEGFTPAKQSNKLWNRFKSACDIFFNARKTHYKSQEKEKEACFKEKSHLLKKLKKFKNTTDSKADIKQLKEFSNKWYSLDNIPLKKMKINDEFLTLINSKFEKLGLNREALSSEQYKNKIRSLKGNKNAIKNEKESLEKRMNALKKEITQYENNMSFLGLNKSTQPLKIQVEKQIIIVNDKIDTLKKKLQLLNKG